MKTRYSWNRIFKNSRYISISIYVKIWDGHKTTVEFDHLDCSLTGSCFGSGYNLTSEVFVMYYIAKNTWRRSIWRTVKRLRDFQPEEGVQYVVATSRQDYTVPIYVGVNGKLKKTDAFTFNLGM